MVQIPKKMQGVQLVGHGDFDQQVYRDDIDVPTPAPGEVLIQVGAAGVNNTDINTRIGWYSKSNETNVDAIDHDVLADSGGDDDGDWSGQGLSFPRIQGIDACGTIVAVGDPALSQRIDERVLVEPCLRSPVDWRPYEGWFFGSECDGAFAQFTKVDAVHAHKIDSDLSDAELASFPCSWSTAENMLTRAEVKQGDRVLVTGASGGVGSATIQLARRRGAIVVAQCGRSKFDLVKAQGAEITVDREADLVDALGAESVDVVVDLVAGAQWPMLLEVLKRGGRYAVAGAIGGPLVELDVRTLYLKDLSFFGCTILEQNVFKNLVSYIENGEISPIVSKTYPLSDIVTAQKDFMTKRHVGKLVLIPPSL
jgi:NADPH:quinone reductase-like Zn-dependent oxidoreductase